MTRRPLSIAFVWHLHQPYYRDLATGACTLPWVRLHAAKDYLDMVKRLEAHPTIHQTFNIVPSLLDQLEEYAPPASRSDRFLELSWRPAEELSEQERQFILQWFFTAKLEHMIQPYPRYHDLLAKRDWHRAEGDWPDVVRRFTAQEVLDVQVWFNLAWIDPWLRRLDPRLARLEHKGGFFTEEEKGFVLRTQAGFVGQVIPAYRAAASRGQIELTTSPYYHPIMPLLCDLRLARKALPELTLPQLIFRHPEAARWQLQEGLKRHEAIFGHRASGVWPPEGGVSEDFVELALQSHVHWTATDEEILWRTLGIPRSASALYRPYLLKRSQGQMAIVFRDRHLSDLIGFVYSQWDANAAVADFLKRLDDIALQCRDAEQPALVTIILDGENAWESYPNDGHEFLTALYQALARDERFRCVTISEFLRQHSPDHAATLPQLFPGSWVNANFATWVGHPDKNAAWTALAAARQALASAELDHARLDRARRSLAVAEGSDWMWWFGDSQCSLQTDEFDRLFRAHLANTYRLAGLQPPQHLDHPIRCDSASLAD